MPRPASVVPFQDARTTARIDALAAAEIASSSRGLGWRGVSAERGIHPGWEVRDAVIRGHYLALNLDAAPLALERHAGGRTERVMLAPGSLWVQPAGEPFSHSVRGDCTYGAVVLDPDATAAAIGRSRLAIAPAYGVSDPRLVGPVRALLAELDTPPRTGALFAESLAAALGIVLAAWAGGPLPAERRVPRPLSARAVRAVRDHLAGHLGRGSSLAELATLAQVTPTQLLRGFRRATGETPHEHLLRMRLEAARERLRTTDEPIAAIAADLGFADQPHLTRVFRRRYGSTPGAFRRGER